MPNEAGLAQATEAMSYISTEARRFLPGLDRAVEDFLVCLGAGGHQIIVGVPGTGKTMLAKVVGRLTGLEVGRVQYTQDMLPADVTGHFVYDRRTAEFHLRRGPVFNNILLADEINRAPPRTQSALLQPMEEGHVTIEGRTFDLPRPFCVIGTMNPVDVEGVYPLPIAQKDRFTLQTRVHYAPTEQEVEFLGDPPKDRLDSIEPLPPGAIEGYLEACRRAYCHPQALRYLVALAHGSRQHPSVLLGISPRAVEQMRGAMQAHAVMRGRAYVRPSDVQEMFRRASPHRLLLQGDAEIDGVRVEDVIQQIIEDTPVPEQT